MQPWENIKRPKVKWYGLKASNSDRVRQGCLHFFTILRSLLLKSATNMHLQPVLLTKIILKLLPANLSSEFYLKIYVTSYSR